METTSKAVGRNGWTLKGFALVLLLALGAGAAMIALPTQVAAGPFPPPCNKYFSVITYYSDATKTTVVGHCYTDGCSGTPQTCTGTKTSYYSFSAVRCSCDV
jgi:hypothetical protein